jgi:hypothetical protein
VFTGKFNHPPVEVLFDRICRENGIEHLLTAPRSPTTTGKIERFHRTMRAEFDTRRVFSSLRTAQQALDEWVAHYNTERPHQSLDGATPAERFTGQTGPAPAAAQLTAPEPDRAGEAWISRRVAANGVISVSWQQICLGTSHAGASVDIEVSSQLLRVWRGAELIRTVPRTSQGEVRNGTSTAPLSQ